MIVARPLTRRVSPKPGTRNSRPTWPVCKMLRSLSKRLLPRRSGISSIRSSTTCTNPGSSLQGEASQCAKALLRSICIEVSRPPRQNPHHAAVPPPPTALRHDPHLIERGRDHPQRLPLAPQPPDQQEHPLLLGVV